MSASVAYANQDRQTIEERVTENLALVKRITYHLMGKLPTGIESDDLMQAGMMGLLAAAKEFSPDRGASFSTYAGIRIRGAILDEIRRTNWSPRSVQKKAQMLSRAVHRVEARTACQATDRDLADELGVSLEDYYDMARDVASSQLLYLDDGEPEQSPEAQNPSSMLQDEGLKKAVMGAIDDLPEKERMVMALYYQEELNLKEIGEVLGVSESRVCQIHGQALIRLRALLDVWAAV
jgi:RNA polymerase sigma factor FliA